MTRYSTLGGTRVQGLESGGRRGCHTRMSVIHVSILCGSGSKCWPSGLFDAVGVTSWCTCYISHQLSQVVGTSAPSGTYLAWTPRPDNMLGRGSPYYHEKSSHTTFGMAQLLSISPPAGTRARPELHREAWRGLKRSPTVR